MEPKLTLLLALVATTYAGPLSVSVTDNTCARTCSTGSTKFQYRPGTTYDYNYEAETRTQLQGASEDHAGLQMSAKVHMEFLSRCDLIMRVTDVSMLEHDPELGTMKAAPREFTEALERNSLRVSFQDGRVEELCPVDNEPTWVLNVKRGILSTFQNNMDDFEKDQRVKESDVSGECDVEYRVDNSGWYNRVIKKTKNLMGCVDRQGYRSSIQGTPYSVDSAIQSLPIVNSSHNCEQTVSKEGLLKKSTIQESYMFRPFARQQSGAVTQTAQKLQYQSTSSQISRPDNVNKRTTLLFEHVTDTVQSQQNRRDLEGKLAEICQDTINGVQRDTAQLFSDLVHIMRKIDASTLSQIFQQIKSRAICSENNARVSKFFLDAIPMVGTSSSLTLLTQMLTNGDVTGMEADMWLTTLAFIQKPTLDMLIEVKPLLTMSSNEGKAMLAVSSLVNSYCRKNNCEGVSEIDSIIYIFQSKIGAGCRVTDANFETVLMSLRALGNAGYASSAISTLNNCFLQKTNPVEVRLSAIEAFRRIPCTADKRQVISLFRDSEEDSELRIAAYRTIIECPSPDIIRQVKTTLENEEVNQVGSYVWSHLTNLMETSDPLKQELRAILEDETLKKEFNLDKRKYSRNYEGSLFIEKLNTGAKAEGDLIWSSKSFIPRSAMVNLTVDLFGHSVNLFEVGGRIEGLEYFLESYFGPNGYFRENDDEETSNEIALSHVQPTKMNRINKRFGKGMDELRGSLYMRVFGNELRYNNFQGLDSLLEGTNVLDMLMNMAKTNDFTFTHSMMFLDSSIIIPTSTGFPMNLTVNGTSTIDLKTSGKVDVRKMSSSPRSMEISGTVQPSGTVQISGMMSVDAFFTKSGLKMVSTLHSSSAVQGKIELSDGQILNMELDLPQKKMDIISVNTAFFTIHRDLEREQRMITENRQSKSICSGSKIAKITGLELCGELQFPNASLKADAPYFPLTGPVNMGISLYKRDTLTGYKVEARSIHNANGNLVRISFSTPESTIDRTFAVDFNLNRRENTLDASFNSPWRTGHFKGILTNERNEKAVMGKLEWDNALRYLVNARLQREKSGVTTKWTPNLELRMPSSQQPLTVSGSVTYKPAVLVDIELTMNGDKTAKLTLENKAGIKGVSGSYTTGQKEYSFDGRVQIDAKKKKTSYKPHLSIRTPATEMVAFGGDITYAASKASVDLLLDKVFTRQVILKASVGTTQKRKTRTIYNAKLDFRSSPMDVKLASKFDNRNGQTIATDIDLSYIIRKYSRNGIKLVSKITNLSRKTLTNVKATTTFEVKRNPEVNFDMTTSLTHNAKHSELGLDFRYGEDPKDENRHIEATAMIDRVIKNWADLSIDYNARMRYQGQQLNVLVKGSHKHDRRDLDSSMTLRSGKSTIISSLILKDSTKELISLAGDFDLSYPGGIVKISESFIQPEENEYRQTLNVQLQKGKKNTIEGTLRKPDANSWDLTGDFSLQDLQPITVNGQYSQGDGAFRASSYLQKGRARYSISLEKEAAPTRFTVDLTHPDRHIIAVAEGSSGKNMYNGKADLRWDAGRDESRRFTMEAHTFAESVQNWNATLQSQCPSRTVTLNMRHFGGPKVLTHMDVEWETGKSISIDTAFSKTSSKGVNAAAASLAFSSPFNAMRDLNIDVRGEDNGKQYKADIDTSWAPSKKFSSTVTLRQPVSLSNLVGTIVAKTPIRGFNKLKGSLTHKIRKALSTDVRFSWNKNFIQTDLTMSNKGDDNNVNVLTQVDIKTSYDTLSTGVLSLSHKSDGRTYGTILNLGKNKDVYEVNNQMTLTSGADYQVDGNGVLKLTSPQKTFKSEWAHSSSLTAISSSSTTTWDDKRVIIKVLGNQDMNWQQGTSSLTLQLETPINCLRNWLLQTTHEHRPGYLDNHIKLLKDGAQIAYSDATYQSLDGQIVSNIVIRDPMFDVENTMNVDYRYQYNQYPMTSQLSIGMNGQTSLIDGSVDRDNQGYRSGILTFRYPILLTDDVVLQAGQSMEGQDLLSKLSLAYASGKSISAESRTRWNDVKKFALIINTPFASMRNLDTEVLLSGSSRSFDASGRLELTPSLRRISSKLRWNTMMGLSSSITINTPFTSMPSFRASAQSSSNGDSRESNLEIEYYPQKVVRLECTYSMADLANIEGNFKLTTPCKDYPTITTKFSHRGWLSRFATHGELEYEIGKKFTTELTFSNLDTTQGTFKVQTPFSRSSYIQSTLKYSSEPTIASEVTFDAPLLSLDYMRMALQHSGDLRSFETNVQLTKARNNIIATVTLATEPSTTASLSLQTPFTGFETMKGTVSYEGTASNFRSNAEMSVGESTASGGLNARVSPDISIESYARSTAFPEMRVSLTQQGTLRKFTTHGEINGGNRGQIVVDLNADTLSTFMIQATVQTPVEGFRNLRAMVSHEGSLRSFHSTGEVTYMDNKQISGDLLFQIDPTISTTATFTTPFRGYEMTRMTFTHKGQTKSINTHGEIMRNKDQSEFDFNLNYARGIDADLALRSPYFDNVKVSINHDGSLRSFSSRAKLTYGRGNRYLSTVMFQSDPTITSTITLQTPIAGLRDLALTLTHEGSLSNFNSNGLFTNRGKRLEADISLRTGSLIIGSASLKSSFSTIKSMDLSIRHEGGLASFKCHGEFAYGEDRSVGDITFDSTSGLNSKVLLKSPFINDVDATFQHSGPLTSFNTNAQILYGGVRKVNAEISLNTVGGVAGQLSIETPIEGMESSRMSIRHDGSLRQFQSHGDLNMFGIQMDGDISFTVLPNIEGTVTLKSSFAKTLSGSFDISGPMSNFRTQAEIAYGSKKQLEMSSSLNTERQQYLWGEFVLKSVLMRDIEVTHEFHGSFPTNCRSNTELKYGGDSQMKVDHSLNTQVDPSGFVRLSSPLLPYRTMDVTFDHTGPARNFRTRAHVSLDSDRHSADVAFNSETNFQGKIDLTSPLFRDINVGAEMNGPLQNFVASAGLSYGNVKQVDISATFDATSDINGEFSLSTPVDGFRLLRLATQNQKTPVSITSHGEVQIEENKSEIDFSLKHDRNTEGNFKLKTPFTEDAAASFSYDGTMKDFIYHAEESYGTQTNAIDATFNLNRGGKIGLKSTSFRPLTAAVAYTVAVDEFTSHVEASNGNSRSEIDITANVARGGKVSVKSPMIPDTTLTLDYSGSVQNFQTHFDISVGPDRPVSFDASADTENDVDVNLRLVTPIETFANSQFGLRHVTTETGTCTSHIEVTIGESRHEWELEFNKNSAHLNLKSPFFQDIIVSYSVNGNLRSMRGQAELRYAETVQFAVDGNYALRDEKRGSISITTPFVGFERMTSNIRHQGQLNNFQTHADLSIGRDEYSTDISFTTTPKIQGSFTLNLPFADYRILTASFDHSGSMDSFQSHGEANVWNNEMSGDLSFRRSPTLQGTMSMKSPFFSDIDSSFEITPKQTGYGVNGNFNYDGNTYTIDSSASSEPIAANFRIGTPISGFKTLSGAFNFNIINGRFETSTTLRRENEDLLNVNAQFQNQDKMTGDFSVAIKGLTSVSSSFSHEGGLSNFKTEVATLVGEIRRTGNVQFSTTPIQGSLVISMPQDVSASFRLNNVGNNRNFHLEGTYEEDTISADASYSYARGVTTSGFQVKTPFEGFKNMQAALKHQSRQTYLNTHVEVEIQPNMKYELDNVMNWRNIFKGSLSIKTPMDDYREAGLSYQHEGSFPNIKSSVQLTKANQLIEAEATLNHGSTTNGRFEVTTPFSNYRNLVLEFNRRGNLQDFQADASATLGTSVSSANVEYSFIGNKLQTKLLLKNPYSEDFRFDLTHNGDLSEFTTTLDTSFGNENSLSSETTFRHSLGTIDLTTATTATLVSVTKSGRVTIHNEYASGYCKTSVSANILDRTFNFASNFQRNPSIEGSISLQSPFENLQDVGIAYQHSGNNYRFSSSGELKYASDKKIEGKVDFFRYKWERIQTSVEVNTPFTGYESTIASYRHSAEASGLECNADFTIGRKRASANLRASTSPLSFSLTTKSPITGFEKFDVSSKLEFDRLSYTADVTLSTEPTKMYVLESTANLKTTPMTFTAKLTTPIVDFENFELRLGHSGNLQNFQSTVSIESSLTSPINGAVNFRYTSPVEMEAVVMFNSQINNFENLKFALSNTRGRNNYRSKTEASWSTTKSIVLDGSYINKYGRVISGNVAVSTPFEILRSAKIDIVHSLVSNKYNEQFSTEYNGQKIIDLEADYTRSSRSSAVLQMRAPRSMRMEVDGSWVRSQMQGSAFLDWGTDNIRLEGLLQTNGPTVTSLKIIRPQQTLATKASYDSNVYKTASNAEISWGPLDTQKIGFDMEKNYDDISIKIDASGRSVQVTGSSKISGSLTTTEGYFLWDASRDQTKKVGFRSAVGPQGDALKADVTLMMPSFGKDLQLDSEMTLNKGRVMFDGKTELSYSTDSRKTITVISRLEDISAGYSGKNYSFVLGISQPYSTVDVQLTSYLGSNNERWSTGLDMTYLTARRETKTFSVKGEVNKLRKDVEVEVSSPLKNIRVSGNIRLDAPYRLSIMNTYGRIPLNTYVTMDPSRKSVDLQMNYDIAHPDSIFRINARYINSSAISAEMYHTANSRRITDAFVFMRLNTSRLLHTRVHWRPGMIEDLQAFSSREMNKYSNGLSNTWSETMNAMRTELPMKKRLIQRAFADDMEPFMVALSEKLQAIELMYESNDYYLHDLADTMKERALELKLKYENLKERATIDIDLTRLQRPVREANEYLLDQMVVLSERLAQASDKMAEIYQAAADKAYNMTQHPSLVKYTDYLQQVRNFPLREHFNNMADKYTSAIYNARELMNAQLSEVDFQYVNSLSNSVMQQGKNAYKYWEIEENVQHILDNIYELMKEAVEEEISKLQNAIWSFERTRITVWDPQHGEIQADFHLPLPLRSLDTAPTFDVRKYVNRLNRYIPKNIDLSGYIPSSDISTWIPPFDAVATVTQGSHFVTFDGKAFDFSGQCSYVLARDYTDGNFTIILKNDQDRELIVMAKGNTFEILRNGSVLVNGRPVELTYASDNVILTRNGDMVNMDGDGSFNIQYHVTLDVYTISVSGWYYGKTGGLLGTYDNEYSNDLVTSYSRVIDDVNRFARTWEVGTGRCR